LVGQPDWKGGLSPGERFNFGWSAAGLECDAASAEVSDSFGPKFPPEVVNLHLRALRPSDALVRADGGPLPLASMTR
jgi:hypothetical protein